MRRRGSVWIYATLLACGCGSAAGAEIAKAAIATGVAIVAAAAYHAASGDCWAQCSHGYVCDRRRGVCVTAVDRSGAPITFTRVEVEQFCIEEEDGSVLCPDDPQTNYGASANSATPRSSANPRTQPAPTLDPNQGTCQGLCYAHERCRVIDGMAYCVTADDPLYDEDDPAPAVTTDDD